MGIGNVKNTKKMSLAFNVKAYSGVIVTINLFLCDRVTLNVI